MHSVNIHRNETYIEFNFTGFEELLKIGQRQLPLLWQKALTCL